MVTQVYMTIITMVTPAREIGSEASVGVAPSTTWESAYQVSGELEGGSRQMDLRRLDEPGHLVRCAGRAGESRWWVRRRFIANGVVGIAVLLAYMPPVIPQPACDVVQALAGTWIVTLPVAPWLTARKFRRQAVFEPPEPRR